MQFPNPMRLYNFLTQCKSSTRRKFYKLLTSECWSSHILSAIEGSTQSYMFKQKLLSCEPIDLNRVVVDRDQPNNLAEGHHPL